MIIVLAGFLAIVSVSLGVEGKIKAGKPTLAEVEKHISGSR